MCEYGLKVTREVQSLVPIAVRYPLLQTWVRTKQLLQSNIGKSLGADDDVSPSDYFSIASFKKLQLQLDKNKMG